MIETLAFVFLSCKDAREVTDGVLVNKLITPQIANEIIIELDIASGGKCNLPRMTDGNV